MSRRAVRRLGKITDAEYSVLSRESVEAEQDFLQDLQTSTGSRYRPF